MKKFLIFFVVTLLLLLSVDNLKAQLSNIPVTGFNADVVAEGNNGAATNTTTNDVDGGGYVFVSTTFNPGSGICKSGSDAWPSNNQVASTYTTGLTFTLQDPTVNNSLRLAQQGTGILYLTTPVSANVLYLLALGGSGSCTIKGTITFTDSTTQAFTNISVPDWCGGSSPKASSQKYYRITRSSTTCNGSDCQYMFQPSIAIDPANQSKQIAYVLFDNYSGSGILHILAMGGYILQPCSTPANQAVNLSLNPGATTVGISFTASTGTPTADHYLIVRSTSSTLSDTPYNGTTYTTGNSLGGGTVAAFQTATSFTDNGLNQGKQYYYFIFAANSTCTNGPLYLASSPLAGNITTAIQKSITVTGFTDDVVANGSATSLASTSVGVDGAGHVFISSDFNPGNGVCATTGTWPSANTVYSLVSPSLMYTLQDPSVNNSLRIPSGNSGTLYFTSPVSVSKLFVLGTGGDGTCNVTATITFTDNTTETITGSIGDWCGGPSGTRATSRFYRDTRTSNSTCSIDLCQYMYEMGLNIVNQSKYITSVTFANSGGKLHIFAIGGNILSMCTSPVNQPTSLLLTPNFNKITGSFTSEATADHYLIVRSTSSTLNDIPYNGTAYTTGTSLGGGTVVAYQTGTSFIDTNLNTGTMYYYYIFAANSLSCSDGPIYLTAKPLTNNYSTYYISGPLNGTYNIDNTMSTELEYMSTFSSFGDALNALNAVGVSGPVTFNVISNTFTEQVDLEPVASVDANNTVTFQGQGSSTILQYNANDTSNNYVVRFNGCQYITFQSMAIQPLNATYANAVVFANGASNINITGNTITGTQTVNTGHDQDVIRTIDGTAYNNIAIGNNKIYYGSYGIWFSTTASSANVSVLNNNINNAQNRPASFNNIAGLEFGHNTVYNDNSANGMFISNLSGQWTIHDNTMSNINASGSGTAVLQGWTNNNGIGVGTEALIYNNYMYGGSNISYICDLGGGFNYVNLLFNTFVGNPTGWVIHLNNYYGCNSFITAENNIFYSSATSSLFKVSAAATNQWGGGCATDLTDYTFDYNDYYTTGSVFGIFVNTNCSSLAQWQTATNQETHSLSVDPIFTADDDPHVNNSALLAGTTISGMTTDLDGNTRRALPSIGAEELGCVMPLAQPTNLILTRSNTTVSGTFTASASADHYLIVRSTSDTLSATPVSGTIYTAGTVLGGDTIIAYQTDTTFADINLVMCSQYYYHVFAANCTGTPQYLTTNPLTSVTKWHSSVDITNHNATYVVNSDTTWVSFIPSNDTCNIVFGVPPGLNALIDTIYMYIDLCNTLTLINTYAVNDSSRNLYFTNLNIGFNYYFKIKFNNILNASFSAGIVHKSLDSIPCPPDPCNLIINGGFECIDSYVIVGDNSGTDYNPFFDNGSNVLGWKGGWGTPNLNGNGSPTNCAFLWSYWEASQNAIWGEGIYQDISLTTQVGFDYVLSFSYYNPQSTPVDLHVDLANNFTPTNINGGDPIPPGYYSLPLLTSSGLHIITSNTWVSSAPVTFQSNLNYPRLTFYPLAQIPAQGSSAVAQLIEIDNVVLQPKVKLTASINPVCQGYPTTITASLPTNVTNVIYSWYVNGIPVAYNTSTITVSPTITTRYSIIAVDGNSCIDTGSIVVNVTPILPVQFNLQNPYTKLCSGIPITITASVAGFTTGDCQWSSVPAGGTYGNTQSITVSPSVNTTYTVTTDVDGCPTTGVFVVNVTQPTATLLTMNWSWTNACQSLATFSFVLPSDPDINYIWNLPDGASIIPPQTSVNNINVNWNNIGPGTVSVNGYDLNGCIVYHGSIDVDPNYCVSNPIQLNSLTTSQIVNILLSNGGVNNNNHNIIFNGVTVIDQDLTFTNCPNIMLGSNARINVMPGITLTFDNCTLRQTCNCPWDGIFAESFTSQIVLKSSQTGSNCIVRDAKNAIVSNNGGNFQITNTSFFNDNIGLWVHNYNPPWIYDFNGNKSAPPPHPGYIASSNFSFNSSLPGYYASLYNTGIIVDTVYNLTIGDKDMLLQRNEFTYLQWGIKAKKSQLDIIWNLFENIPYSSYCIPLYTGNGEPEEAAIFCKTEVETVIDPPPPSMPLVNIVTIEENLLENLNIGVYGYHNQMNINKNHFDAAYNSIYLKDFDSPSVISNNEVDNLMGSSDPNNSLHNVNILVEESSSYANVTLDINDNTLANTIIPNGINSPCGGNNRTGIMVRNCSGAQYGDSHCIIQDNSLSHLGYTTSTEYYDGISVYNCNYAQITNNFILSQTLPDATYDDRLRGIYLSTSQNAQISKNQIIEMGDGIYVDATSFGSQYFCNDLDRCWHGFYFNSATLSDQLVVSPIQFGINNTSDNYWYDVPFNGNPSLPADALRRLSGTVSNTGINWYHRDATSDVSNIFSPYVTATPLLHPLYGIIFPIPNSPSNSCNAIGIYPLTYSLIATTNSDTTTTGGDSLIANATVRDQLIGKIVNDSASYQSFQQEHKYMAKEFAYKLLDATPSYMSLGTNDDAIYQNFYDTVRTGNNGKLYQIGKYINVKNYTAANNLNSTLMGINTIEYNRITVNNIYLNKVVNNQFLGLSDSLTLVDIAYQTPLSGGDAVISARVILGINPFIANQSQTKSIKDQENAITPLSIKVYPNPAYDKLYIKIEDTTDGMAKIELYDLTGKLVYNTSINAAIKLQTLNVSSIKEGMYSLHITTINQTFNQKLVIIK